MSTETESHSQGRILFWGLLVLAILLVVCIAFQGKRIPQDITQRVGHALTTAGFNAKFLQEIDGRVAILSGEIEAEATREHLMETVQSVRGVRRVVDRLVIVKSIPSRLSLSASADGVLLSGVMPDQTTVDNVVKAMAVIYGQNNITNRISIQKQARQPDWLDKFQALLPALQTMAVAEIEIGDDAVMLSGVVASAEERAAIEKRTGTLLGHLRLNNQIVVRPTAAVKPAPAGDIPLPTLYFKHARTELTEDSKPLLDEIVSTLKRRPDLRIEVAAHTDSSGGEVLNTDLSERRAQAIVQALVSGGIDPGRLVPQAYSESRPVADNTTTEARARNRRVEFKVIE